MEHGALVPVSPHQHSPGPGTLPGNWFDEDSQWTQDTDAYTQSLVVNAGRAIFINKIVASETINLILCKPWSLVKVSMRLRSHWPDELGWEGRRWEGEGCSLGAPRQSLSDLDRANISHLTHTETLAEAIICMNFSFYFFLFLKFVFTESLLKVLAVSK